MIFPLDAWPNPYDQMLRNQYPELQKAWDLYERAQWCMMKYTDMGNEISFRSYGWQLWNRKKIRRHQIKMRYLRKLTEKRFDSYQLIEKLVRDY